MQLLKSEGKRNKPRESQVHDNTTLETKLFKANTLGNNNPRTLIHSKCRDLCSGDAQLCVDEGSGIEYLLYDIEHQTKTRTEANPRDIPGKSQHTSFLRMFTSFFLFYILEHNDQGGKL